MLTLIIISLVVIFAAFFPAPPHRAVKPAAVIGAVIVGIGAPALGSTAFYCTSNAGAGTVSVVNSSTSAIIATVTVGSSPQGILVTQNGSYIYVANYGGSTVSIISTSSWTVTATVTVGSSPGTMAENPAGTYVYVANRSGGTVSVIQESSQTVVQTVTVGSGPYGVAFTPNGAYAYVTNNSASTVSIINTSTYAVTGPVTVGSGPHGIACTPNGSYMYVVCPNGNCVSVISTSSNTVTATITVATTPLAIAISSSGSYAYVTGYGSNVVSVISTSSNTITSTISGFSTCYGITIDGSGNFAYVANYGNATVSIVSLISNTIVGSTTVGTQPYWIASYGSSSLTFTVFQDTDTSTAYTNTSSISIPFSTGGVNRIAVLTINNNENNTAVSGIASSGLTWTLQKALNNSTNQRQEIWTAPVSSQATSLATTVTLTASTYVSAILDTFYLPSPTACPVVTASAMTAPTGTNPTVSITTVRANDQIYATYCENGNSSTPSAGSGYTATCSAIRGSFGGFAINEIANSPTATPGAVSVPFVCASSGAITGALALNAPGGGGGSPTNLFFF